MTVSCQTVPFAMLRGLLRFLELTGHSRAALTTAAELGVEDAAGSDPRLSREEFERACELAIALTSDPALGLRWAALMMEHSFGPLADELARTATLRRAFALLARFENFFTSDASFQVLERGDQVQVHIPAVSGRSLPLRRFLAELSVAWHVKLIGSFAPETPVTAVAFTYPAPSYADTYEALFETKVSFAQPVTEVRFPRAWLDAPRASLGKRARSTGAGAAQESYSARLYAVLRRRAPERVSMPEAARTLGISERSLRRRIATEGSSFKEIEFRALAEAARQMLVHQGRTIEDAASELGFSGVRAFRRAFKRWVGQHPENLWAESKDSTGS